MIRKTIDALFAALALAALAYTQEPLSVGRTVETVRTLTDDQFQGRAPDTLGEERTVAYLVGRFQALGLKPGGLNGRWVQPVPLRHTQRGAPEKLELATAKGPLPLLRGTDAYRSTVRAADVATTAQAPLVFVDYGVNAPERKWDDFKGVDLKGKVAVFLINHPEFEAVKDDAAFGKFGGKTMTQYGRWTYEFEEAARRGVVGVAQGGGGTRHRRRRGSCCGAARP